MGKPVYERESSPAKGKKINALCQNRQGYRQLLFGNEEDAISFLFFLSVNRDGCCLILIMLYLSFIKVSRWVPFQTFSREERNKDSVNVPVPSAGCNNKACLFKEVARHTEKCEKLEMNPAECCRTARIYLP